MGGKLRERGTNILLLEQELCVPYTSCLLTRQENTPYVEGRETTLMTHDLTGGVARTEGRHLHHHLAHIAHLGKRLASEPILLKAPSTQGPFWKA